MKTKIRYILYLLIVMMTMTACSDTLESVFGGEIADGEAIAFSTLVPDAPATRSPKEEWEKVVQSYKAVQEEYTFDIEMWREGATESTGHGTYQPSFKDNDGIVISNYDGTLQNCKNPLYWQDNVNRWGFRAKTISSEDIEADQSTQALWLRQDLLVGHSYLPIWTGDADYGSGTNPDVMQYKTSKQWYADNKTAKELSGLMVQQGSNGDEYKKVPLYMKHQRAWITVVLRAGEGVRRDALKFETAAQNIKMSINSFKAGATEPFVIEKAWASETLIDYPKDKNGEAQTNVSTTRYDAIVEPHNYATNKDEEVIAKVNLSNQNFSFYAGNDERFLVGHSQDEVAAALNAYNLEAGKHLTIEITLSRESRKILITAWIEDWTEVATATICDDYGQNGDPVVIKNRDELIAFLSNPKVNKQGSVGIVQPTELNLDAPEDWTTQYDLNATLNLAGCVLRTKHQLFNTISTSGNLVNGTVEMQEGPNVKYAVADKNYGTIERVNVTTTDENSNARATVAGMVGMNSGTIYQCSSSLPVYATAQETIHGNSDSEEYKGYIGGIAAVSKAMDNSSMAIIDGCTVNASVNGLQDGTILGGGIAGYAVGRVSNNTFEYGITVSQHTTYYKNIFAQAGELRAYNNSWPTSITNPISSSSSDSETNPNNYPGLKYDAVIDCQNELHLLMLSEHNITGRNYRISKSFTVSSTNDTETDWGHGFVKPDTYGADENNVSFNLDGNNKTITLTGTKTVCTTDGKNLSEGTVTEYTTAPMLFNYVLGEIKDLTLYLDKPIVASPTENTTTSDNASTTTYNASDAIAPLAYAVFGGTLSNINVKTKADDDPDNQLHPVYVQSSTPAGLVVWALGGATIKDCKVKVPVRMWLPEKMGSESKHYAGGIVACAANATITQCQYLGNRENSLTGAESSTTATQSSNYYYGGIVGGTATKTFETQPQLQITDCSSWYIATVPASGDADQSSKAAIIAYPCYAATDASHTVTNGMSQSNVSEGNWWPVSAVGARIWITGLTEEKIIGKRNSVEPSYDLDF